MKDSRQDQAPAAVAGTPKQAGEVLARWAWTEPAVWTERMLTALEQRVKGGVWFSLMDKVESPQALKAAWAQVLANRGSGGKTPRKSGQSLPAIIADVNRTVRGWYGYFKHSRRWVFRELDGWIRMRLRSILRKRRKRRGRGRGADHQRWPNAFFNAQGLFSMLAAHARESQLAGHH